MRALARVADGAQDVDNDEGYEEGVGDPGPDRPPNTRPVAGAGTLRAQPTNLKPGDETLSVFIEKWGFKDGASKFRDPQVGLPFCARGGSAGADGAGGLGSSASARLDSLGLDRCFCCWLDHRYPSPNQVPGQP
eukprot:123211-Chlamydomonas_euryale.AAC.7